MRVLRGYLLVLMSLSMATSNAFAAPTLQATSAALPRPPQYILISFDGSYTNDMWKATREQALSSGAKVTHFISGVDFLMGSDRRTIVGATDSIYIPPRWKSGRRSDIGFGGDKDQITRRISEVTQSIAAGMEIGGHANAHFDGSEWTREEWIYEFNMFFKFILEVFNINKIDPALTGVSERDWKFDLEPHLRSFRAPYLGRGDGLYSALGNKTWTYDNQQISKSMLYDASDVADSPTDWPDKSKYGVWNFRMAIIPVPGRTHGILSMDYNFYLAQSKAEEDPSNGPTYEKQMYDAYMNWFMRNYYGNRAPINIGHHFSTWNQGAYWRALKTFMNTVCKQPEVECVSGAELVPVLENLGPQVLHSYANGNFSRENTPRLNILTNVKVANVNLNNRFNGVINGIAAIPTKDASGSYSWAIHGQAVSQTRLNLAQLAKSGVSRIDLIRTEKSGVTRTMPLMIDWNPLSDRAELVLFDQPTVAPCDAHAHDEQVNPEYLDNNSI